MNLSEILYALRWLIWDTFRQSIASGIFWLMMGFSVVCIIVCLSVGVQGGLRAQPGLREYLPEGSPEAETAKTRPHGVAVASGKMTIFFGTIEIPFSRTRDEGVHFVLLLMAGFVADTAGVLLALIFTAGFLPTFLDPSAVAVLLAKPVPRWALLVGKFVGVLALVAVQAVVFVGGTWLALGLRTGVWDNAYLFCIPMLLLHFSVFFSFSVWIAVSTRSTVACVFGTILFWLMCWGMNYARILSHTAPEIELASSVHWMVETAYWVLPKPADFGVLLFNGLKANNDLGDVLHGKSLMQSGSFIPELSVLTSILSSAVMLGLAAYEFVTADY